MPAQFDVKWPLKVIQGHVFGGQWKADDPANVCMLPISPLGRMKHFKAICCFLQKIIS